MRSTIGATVNAIALIVGEAHMMKYPRAITRTPATMISTFLRSNGRLNGFADCNPVGLRADAGVLAVERVVVVLRAGRGAVAACFDIDIVTLSRKLTWPFGFLFRRPTVLRKHAVL